MFRSTLILLAWMAVAMTSPAQMSVWHRGPEVSEWLSPLAHDLMEEEEARNRYRDANRLIGDEQWDQAAVLLQDLYDRDSENRNLAFKLALCLRSVKGRLDEAVPLAVQAANGDFAKRYNSLDIEETLPSEKALDLALEVLQYSGYYGEAFDMAHRITEFYPERDFRHIRAKQAMKDCVFAADCTASPRDMGILPETGLNSVARDFSPVVSPDGGSVYFTSYREQTAPLDKRKGRLFRASRTQSGWGDPEVLELGASSEDLTTIGILGDEEALLVHRGRGKAGDVWTAKWDASGKLVWGEKLEAPIASKHWETSMTERFDGLERIFVSDRPGGQGGRDLYRTVLLPDGTWSEPLNLGARINTPGEEESPVLSADGRSLVFSSNGHQGMGGFDLFRCVRLDNGSWSEPEHMGHPLNTPGDEVMVSLDASGQSGYLSSSRQGGLDLDIFSVEVYDQPEEALAVFIGKVLQWQVGDVLEVKSTDGGEPVFRVFRARPGSGSFVAALPACREYRFSWVRGDEVLQSRLEKVACDAAYGNERRVGRLDAFGWAVESQSGEATAGLGAETSATSEMVAEAVNHEVANTEEVQTAMSAVEDAEAEVAVEVTVAPDVKTAEPESNLVDSAVETEEPALSFAEPVAEAPAPSHSFEPDALDVAEPTSVSMVEFKAVSATVEFGYGRYLTRSTDAQVQDMVKELLARRAVGEVPVLEIQGSASFVPVKNKQAYKSNEQLAKMRAEKARDAIIRALSAEGLQVGVDFSIVLDWGVAGPEYQGDATEKREEYRNYQFAKFSLGRQLIEQR